MKCEKLKELLENIRVEDFCENCDCPYYDELNGCEKGGCENYYNFYNLYEAAVEIKNKIEKGTLIERYFIQEDKLPSGKVWYNVCEINETYHSIINQCDTREEAETQLAELKAGE